MTSLAKNVQSVVEPLQWVSISVLAKFKFVTNVSLIGLSSSVKSKFSL